MIRRARTLALVTATACALTACAHRSVPGRTVYKTVVVTPSAQAPSTSPVAQQSSSTPTPTPKPKPKPVEPAIKALPGVCKTLLPVDSIDKVMGEKLRGAVIYNHGGASADISRMSYIDCKYGMVHGKAAAVEIRVSLYRTVVAATSRISATIQDFELHGALASTTSMGGHPATMLLGANMLTYGPTLVKVAKQRTIAVTLRPGWKHEKTLLPQLGLLALKRTMP